MLPATGTKRGQHNDYANASTYCGFKCQLTGGMFVSNSNIAIFAVTINFVGDNHEQEADVQRHRPETLAARQGCTLLSIVHMSNPVHAGV